MSNSTAKNFRYPTLDMSPDVPRDMGLLAQDIDDYLTTHPGPQGVQGTQGRQGVQGVQGVQGTTGIQGLIGTQGTQGVQGVQGAQGVQGTQGLLGTQGILGIQGAQGVQGTQGLNGTQGIQGIQGAQGTSFNYRGQFSVSVSYYVNDVVTYNGSTYIAVYDFPANIGNSPLAFSNTWLLFTAKGDTGPTGATGIQGTTGTQGTTGSQGTIGTQGLNGTQGVQGITGASGSSSSYFNYKADASSQANSQPADGKLRWNNATQTSATSLYVNHLTSDNIDIDLFLAILKQEDKVYVQDANNSDNYQQFKITGTPNIGNNTYVQIPVSYIGAGGIGVTGFSNNHQLVLITFASGVQGTTGLQGVVGSQGVTGLQGIQGTSVQGTQGVQGLQGTSIQGLQGPAGSVQGTQGIQGLQGAGFNQLQGTTGTQGTAGAQGTQGLTPSNVAFLNVDNTFTGKLYTSGVYDTNDISAQASANNISFLPNDVWFDRLRFQNGAFETSTNGTTWTNTTFNSSPFDGRNYTSLTIPASTYYRWTFSNLNFNYMLNKWLRVTCTYTSPNPSYNLTFESSANGSTWTNKGSWTNQTSSTTRRIFNTTDIGSDGYIRITMQNTHATSSVQLANIELLSYRAGDQGGDATGIEGNLPFDWDGYKAITIQPKRSDSVGLTVRNRPLFTTAVTSATGNGTTVTYNFSGSSLTPPMAGETVNITGANPTTFNISSGTILSATATSITVANTTSDTYVGSATLKVAGLNNIMQWYNSDGYLLGYINSGGQLNIGVNSSSGMNIVGTGYFVASSSGLPAMRIQQASGQTGDLFEFRNSAYSTVLGSMAADATLKFPALTSQAASKALLTTNGDTGGFLITTVAAANKGLVIKATASQTADLLQFQNSSGTLIAEFNANGSLELNGKDIELMNIMGAF
jgi:hypothetical protein